LCLGIAGQVLPYKSTTGIADPQRMKRPTKLRRLTYALRFNTCPRR
jgi:hypothetical protein